MPTALLRIEAMAGRGFLTEAEAAEAKATVLAGGAARL